MGKRTNQIFYTHTRDIEWLIPHEIMLKIIINRELQTKKLSFKLSNVYDNGFNIHFS